MRRFALLGAAIVLLALPACGSGGEASNATSTPVGMEAKTIEAGEVIVKIDPITIDTNGASFELTLDTHSVELDMDIAEGASLEVDGTEWTGASWNGDGPSGHHREGTLSFDAGGDASGPARLTLEGFAEPVQATWSFTGGG